MTLPLPFAATTPVVDPRDISDIDRCLTLTQPWGGLIATGVKRIENRPWKPPAAMIGKRFAIHASREIDHGVLDMLRDEYAIPDHPFFSVTSAIIGVARIVGYVSSLAELKHRFHGDVDPDQERFWMGPYAFLLDEIRPLATPVACKGALSFWGLPEQLRNQMVLA